jgi:hypothetical protein
LLLDKQYISVDPFMLHIFELPCKQDADFPACDAVFPHCRLEIHSRPSCHVATSSLSMCGVHILIKSRFNNLFWGDLWLRDLSLVIGGLIVNHIPHIT